MKADDGEPAFYIANYEGGGFSLIAADRHMPPVLAYSEYGDFPMDGLQDYTQVPDGLITWMENTKAVATALRQSPGEENTVEGAPEAWRQITIPCEKLTMQPRSTSGGADKEPLQTPSPCNPIAPSSVIRGPFLASNWEQGQTVTRTFRSYNARFPASNRTDYNLHSPTGCLTTAMAQIMYRWQRPANYQWNIMPANSSDLETARLMFDAAESVGTAYLDDKSTAQTIRAVPALRGVFGYPSANLITYSTAAVESNLNAGQPVILDGNSAQSSFLFWSWPSGDGHAWFCDGYQSSTRPVAGTSISVTTMHFHMNWGWDGAANGLYFYNDWTIHIPGQPDISYPYFYHAIVDIHP